MGLFLRPEVCHIAILTALLVLSYGKKILGLRKPSHQTLAQPRIASANDGLGPTSHLQLTENAGDVVAHRLGTEHQLFSNGRICVALRDQDQNLTLTPSQLRKGWTRCRRSWCSKILH